MKKLILLLAVMTTCAFGQGVRFDGNNTTSAKNVPPGAQANVMTLPFSKVTVCSYPAVPVGGSVCTNTAPIFTDQALTLPITQPFVSDSQGRFGFWIAPGLYSYSIQTAGGAFVGTFALSFNAQVGPQGPGGIGCGAANCVVSSPAVTQTIVQPINTNLNVLTSGTGQLLVNGTPPVYALPIGSQALTQPVNTNFTFNTSGTGSSIFNGNMQLNFNKISNDLNYFNYLFSSNTFQAPTAVTNRTYANPEWYIAVTDNSPFTFNPSAQADGTLTPILHIESFNRSPNDATPIYANHLCSGTVSGNPPNNIGCIGITVAAQNTAGSFAFPEAINAIMQINSTNPTVQAQGIELNAFNNSGGDSRLLDTNAFNRGPYFGIASTAGGVNKMVAAFHAGDQAGSSGWQYGVLIDKATDADFMAGLPGGGNGSQDAFRSSALALATAGSNSSSMPIDFRTNHWTGSVSAPFQTDIRAINLTNATNPIHCLNVSFTTPGSIANICNDGSISVSGISWRAIFVGAATPTSPCNVGDFATNATATSVSNLLWVCFPANVWNPK